MTYGQLAIILGEGYTARTVGYVMHGSPDDVPWQRVINSQGKCSTGQIDDARSTCSRNCSKPRAWFSTRTANVICGSFSGFPRI